MKKAKLIFIIILGSFICNAQNWKSGIGISDQIVRDIIEYNKDTLIAGVEKNGVFVSYDNGNNWTQFALKDESVNSLIKIGKSIIAGTSGHDIYKAISINSIWKRVAINNLLIGNLKTYNDIIYATTCPYSGPGGGIYCSSDSSKTWKKFITNPIYPDFPILNMDFNTNGRVYIGTPWGASYSENQFSWVSTTGIFSDKVISTVNYIGKDSIIYGGGEDIFLSADNGASAQKLSNISGLNTLSKISGLNTFFIDDIIYVASYDTLMYSKRLSEGWKKMNLNRNVLRLTKIQNKLFAETTEGVYISDGSTTNIENIEKDDITIFPNPTTGQFEIKGIGNETISVEILNSIGQQVLKSQNIKNDISDFKPGIYLLRIAYRNRTVVRQIIKK